MQNHKLHKIILTDYVILYFDYKSVQDFLNMLYGMHYACFRISRYQDM